MTDPTCAGQFGAMLDFLDIEPVVQIRRAERGRREFHGSRTSPKLDQSEVYDWIPSFRRHTASIQPACSRLADRYEAEVNKFG